MDIRIVHVVMDTNASYNERVLGESNLYSSSSSLPYPLHFRTTTYGTAILQITCTSNNQQEINKLEQLNHDIRKAFDSGISGVNSMLGRFDLWEGLFSHRKEEDVEAIEVDITRERARNESARIVQVNNEMRRNLEHVENQWREKQREAEEQQHEISKLKNSLSDIKEEYERQLSTLQHHLEAVESEKLELLDKVNELEGKIKDQGAEIERLDEEVAILTIENEDLKEELAVKQAEASETKDTFQVLVCKQDGKQLLLSSISWYDEETKKDKMAQCSTEIAWVENEREELYTTINNLKKDIIKVDKERWELAAIKVRQVAEIERLKEEFGVLKHSFTSLVNSLSHSVLMATHLGSHVAAAQADIDRIQYEFNSSDCVPLPEDITQSNDDDLSYEFHSSPECDIRMTQELQPPQEMTTLDGEENTPPLTIIPVFCERNLEDISNVMAMLTERGVRCDPPVSLYLQQNTSAEESGTDVAVMLEVAGVDQSAITESTIRKLGYKQILKLELSESYSHVQGVFRLHTKSDANTKILQNFLNSVQNVT